MQVYKSFYLDIFAHDLVLILESQIQLGNICIRSLDAFGVLSTSDVSPDVISYDGLLEIIGTRIPSHNNGTPEEDQTLPS